MITVGTLITGHQDIQYGWQNTPNSAGGVSVKIRFRNDTQKVIKYITFITIPYNAVNDVVSSQFDSQQGRLQATGPIDAGKTSEFYWENCWYNSTIVEAKIAKVEILYMDGTKETLSGNQINYENLGACYVATAVYASYDCPQVWALRRYRDYTLAKTWYGRLFIKTYYAISPTIVKWFGHTEWFKRMWKGKLDRIVADLKRKGVKDTPYEDKNW